MLKAFRFRLEPADEQARKFSRYQGRMPFVWNKALALQKGRLDAGYPLLSYGELAKLLTLWRHSEEYGFLAVAPKHPLQRTLKFLMQSITKVSVPKAGWVKFLPHEEVLETLV